MKQRGRKNAEVYVAVSPPSSSPSIPAATFVFIFERRSGEERREMRGGKRESEDLRRVFLLQEDERGTRGRR